MCMTFFGVGVVTYTWKHLRLKSLSHKGVLIFLIFNHKTKISCKFLVLENVSIQIYNYL